MTQGDFFLAMETPAANNLSLSLSFPMYKTGMLQLCPQPASTQGEDWNHSAQWVRVPAVHCPKYVPITMMVQS